MINITDKKARRRYQQDMDRHMTAIESIFAKDVKPILKAQFYAAAKIVHQGNIDSAVDKTKGKLKSVFNINYKRIASSFSKKVYDAAEKAKLKSISPEYIKEPIDEFWQEINLWSATQMAQKVAKVQDTTKRNIASIIAKGMEAEETNREIAKRLTQISDKISMRRAMVIARNETHTVAVKSVDTAIKTLKIEMEKEWVSAKDDRTRTRTRGDKFEHFNSWPNGPDGERVKQDGVFKGTGESLEYPGDPKGSAANTILCRCFPAGTKIFGATPKNAMRQWYDGELVEITTSMGFKLAGTPNHPIMAPKGKISLDSLNKGDSIFSCGFVKGLSSCNPDIESIQPDISDIFNSFSNSGHINRIPRISVDFHGQIPDKNVDIVSIPNRSLWDTSKIGFQLVDPFDKLELTVSDLTKCFAPCGDPLNMSIVWYCVTFGGSIRHSCYLLFFLLSHFGHSVEHCLRAVSMFQSRFFERDIDTPSICDIEFSGDTFDRHAVLKHFYNLFTKFLSFSFSIDNKRLLFGSFDSMLINNPVNCHCRRANLLGDNFTRQPGLIQFDSVVDIKRRSFSGHVYNLHDIKGFYVANGILVHNCVVLYHTTKRSVN